MRVAADNDGVRPAGYDARDRLAEDGLAEHGAAQDVTDGAVRREPHLLQLELCKQGERGEDDGATMEEPDEAYEAKARPTRMRFSCVALRSVTMRPCIYVDAS